MRGIDWPGVAEWSTDGLVVSTVMNSWVCKMTGIDWTGLGEWSTDGLL